MRRSFVLAAILAVTLPLTGIAYGDPAKPEEPKSCAEAKTLLEDFTKKLTEAQANFDTANKDLDAQKALPKNVALQKIIDNPETPENARTKAKDSLAENLKTQTDAVALRKNELNAAQMNVLYIQQIKDRLCAEPKPTPTEFPDDDNQVSQVPSGAVDTGGNELCRSGVAA